MAGDEAFAAIPDLLDFEPVPRRPHANGWSPEHQRAFIAALAITGSARQAARHVGRATFGAEQLRLAKGGKSFAAAWDSALDLARDRELNRLHGNLGELKARTDAEQAQAKAEGRLVPGDSDYDEEGESYEERMNDVRERIWDKLQKLRKRTLIEEIMPFPEKRAAWDTLHGPAETAAIENGTWDPNVNYEGESADAPASSSPATTGDPPSSNRSSRAKSRGAPQDKPGPRAEARSQSGGLGSTASEQSRPNKGPRVRRV